MFQRYQLGDEAVFHLQCKTPTGVPTAPDAAPYLDLWLAGTTEIETVRMVPVERYKATGVFLSEVFLGSAYSAGYYMAVARYSLSSVQYTQVYYFTILSGGNADGPIIAMKEYRQPGGVYIVQQRRSGRITFGRNPALS